MTITPATRRTLLISSLLALATLAVYWPVRHFEFVNYDDGLYVFENNSVQRGLTWANLRWAFTSRHSSHWHPVTWLSLMTDAEWHGLNAGGYHLTNLLLHTANTVLLFLVLRRLTGDRQSSVVSHQLSVGAEAKGRSGAKFSPITGRRSLSPDPLWPSAWVAALFALHPLHVESVAWVTERKDVLSGLFWLLTLAAYGRYTASDQSSVVSDQLPKETGRGASRSRSTANRSLMPPRRRWYALTVLCFALGLMAKPMLVTLPFVMLLLDWWPLRRRPAIPWGRLVGEKIPLFLLAAASCWVTLAAGKLSETPVEHFPWGHRIANAVVAYITYLLKMIWPAGLACFYPHPWQWPTATVAGAGIVLGGLTMLALWARRHNPAVRVGWCWYLGTLVPVIGLVQVGSQAFADRYTYLPLIGIWIAIAWGLTDWAANRRLPRLFLAGGGMITVIACGILTHHQLPVWRNSLTLFSHAVAVTTNNALAHNNLGLALAEAGRPADAFQQFELALRISPQFALAHYNLAVQLKQRGLVAEAIEHYQQAVRHRPQHAPSHNNLGLALVETGRRDEALQHFTEAVRRQPDYAEAHANLGAALTETGRWTEAIDHYRQALRLQPTLAKVHANLGVALMHTEQTAAAIECFQRAIELRPADARWHYQLGLALEAGDRYTEAIPHFEQALRLDPHIGRRPADPADALHP